MKKNIVKIIIILSVIVTISFNYFPKETFGEDIMLHFDSIVENYYSTEVLDYDTNNDGIIDIYDLARGALDLRTIEIDNIIRNYVEIISEKEKKQYSDLGYNILSAKCFPVTSEGIDLFAYVNAARGMAIEIIEGDNCFEVINDKLYLKGQAPAVAKVRLVNRYATSEEFYIYGTSDREMHDYTYDYIINAINIQ